MSVGRVDGSHGTAAAGRLEIARVVVSVVAGQPAEQVLDRRPGEDGDAVIGLLAVDGDVVAELLDLQAREVVVDALQLRSEAHTSELQSLMRISYAVFCLKKNMLAYSSTSDPYAYIRSRARVYMPRAAASTTAS